MKTSRQKKDEPTTKIEEGYQRHSTEPLMNGCISNAFFQSLLESLPHAIVILDTEQHFLFFNRAFQELMRRLLGKEVTPGAKLKHLYEHVPVMQQRALVLFNKAMEGDTCTITDTLLLDQTLLKDYKILSSPLLDDQGTCIGATALFKEEDGQQIAKITMPVLQETLEKIVSERTIQLEEKNFMLQQEIAERKRVEEELKRNEQRFRWLTDAMPHLVWEMSMDGTFIEYANQRWIDYRGIRQVPGPTPGSQGFTHPDDIEKMAQQWRQIMKTGESFEGEFRIQRTVDGVYRWHLVRCQPLKDSEGKITHWLGTATDIHDSKEAQELLKRSEQNFRLLAEVLPQVVWTARPDGWLDYYNQKWFDYTGTTLEQTQGWGWEPMLHADDVQQCVDIWTHSFQTGEDYQVEYRLKRAADGMYRWHQGRALALRDQQGQIIKWVGTGTDIHDWKSAQEQLAHLLQNEQTLRAEAEATNERLEQMNKVQSDFISIVSHEFRTTLTGIQGFSELLCEEGFSPEEVKDYAGDIYSDAKRLTRMINDLLDLERMKSGKMSLNLEAVNINTILKEVVDHARPATSQHNLLLALDAGVPIFWGDSDKLIQVITNLTSNAIKYSPEGDEILLKSKREKNTVHISIQDHGMGIPANALEEVFAPYSRIDVQRTRYIKGTGLGLAIVRQIIDMHEGQVWVESEMGKGSIFHFVLPLKAPETKTETEEEAQN